MAVAEATGVQEGAGELANLAMTIIVGPSATLSANECRNSRRRP